MAGDKTELKAAIRSAYETVKDFDGTEGQTTENAIEIMSSTISDAIESYVLSLTMVSTSVDVSSAIMIAGGLYPVVSSNDLISKVQDDE